MTQRDDHPNQTRVASPDAHEHPTTPGAPRHAAPSKPRRAPTPLERTPDDGPDGLVERVQAGDHQAGALLYRRHRPRVRQYLRTIVKDDHEADDLAQQVFTAAFDHIHRYRDRGLPFEHWRFAIASNAARKHLRTSRRATLTDPTLLQIERERDAARTATHGDNASASFHALTETLATTQRQILLLIYGFGMTPTETATILGRTPAAIRQAHTRGLANLTARKPRLGL